MSSGLCWVRDANGSDHAAMASPHPNHPPQQPFSCVPETLPHGRHDFCPPRTLPFTRWLSLCPVPEPHPGSSASSPPTEDALPAHTGRVEGCQALLGAPPSSGPADSHSRKPLPSQALAMHAENALPFLSAVVYGPLFLERLCTCSPSSSLPPPFHHVGSPQPSIP